MYLVFDKGQYDEFIGLFYQSSPDFPSGDVVFNEDGFIENTGLIPCSLHFTFRRYQG